MEGAGFPCWLAASFSVIWCKISELHRDNRVIRRRDGLYVRRISSTSGCLLKLSGEALAGDLGYGIDPKVVDDLAEQIAEIVKDGVQMAVVVGGGNIFRGLAGSAEGMDRAQADYIGMLATVMNALALQDSFERHGIFSRVQSAINMQEVSEPYIRRRAIRHMEKGRVVILAAGTGNPYFTTDTTAALRACELDVDVPHEGHEGGRRVRQRPEGEPRCQALRPRQSYMDVLSAGPERDGLHGHVAVHGQRSRP